MRGRGRVVGNAPSRGRADNVATAVEGAFAAPSAPAANGAKRGKNGVSGEGPVERLISQNNSTKNASRNPVKGGVVDPAERMRKRARAHYLSVAIARELMGVEGTPLYDAYRRTMNCTSCIHQHDGKMVSTYCGGRWCIVCGRIREARAIEAYVPIVEAWEDPHMVTLTVPNPTGDELPAMLERMKAAFESCRRSMKRTHGVPLVGVRKIEATYNKHADTYHPHYHVIVETRKAAQLLRSLWLDRFEGDAISIAQDVRPCNRGGLLELFKYATKMVTKAGKGGLEVAPPRALDIIFRALRGRRVWQPLGFKLAADVAEAIDGEEVVVDQAAESFKREGEEVWWVWDHGAVDWVDRATGETLTDYVPSAVMLTLVASMSVEVIDDG